MKIHRIEAMVIRQLYNWRHSLDRLSDTFYWPALDLIIWGLMSIYLRNHLTSIPFIVIALLSGLIFWLIIWRSQYEITVNLLSEVWDKNLINIFGSPLTIWEWIISAMILGSIKLFFSLLFMIAFALFLYAMNLFSFGFILLPFVVSLLITGWAAGFFVAGFIIRFGAKIQTLAWVGVSVLMPFSAVFYPVATLPSCAQSIAKFVPSSYVFEGMREILFTGNTSYDKLFISFALNILYLTMAIWFFVFMFNKSRKLGLGRLI
ncbi:MAG: ABC transporter permease [Candidatus Levyibacteriota bacterium]